jgi:glucose-1-phosphate adenylyltransferase
VKRSVVSFAVTVDSHSFIKDSVILPKVTIGKNCRITRAIIDKETEIPDGTIIGEDIEEDRKRFHVSEEGIVLVTPEMMGQYSFPFDGSTRWREKN